MHQANTAQLFKFIEASKSKGASDEFLTSFLMRRGWSQDDVYTGLGQYWEQATGLAVPDRTAAGESSRDAFLYLLSFSTLATWSGALGSMLFRFIDHWFPDPVAHDQVFNLRQSVTWQMASVAVAFPIFVLVMRTILREANDRPERLQSGVRKWLTYIALLLTAGAMICDLIWFLDYFLTGELTVRFVLKALTVMSICGAIFAYYLSSLRWDRNTDVEAAAGRSLRFGAGAAAAVIVSFCIGIGVAGTPAQQRQMEADRKRVQDLRAIASAAFARHNRAELLPANLPELIGRGVTASQITDPETKAPYEYRPTGPTNYELCATFNEVEEQAAGTMFWHHGKGRTCFTMNASHPPAW